MGGKLHADFRSGSWAEYMAHFGLSRFGTVTAIPRQEDFGVVDLICVLLRQESDNLYPEGAFYVQVKANKDDIVLAKDDVSWISNHLNLPWFVCVPDRPTQTLAFYTCSSLWQALFLRAAPAQITLKLGGKPAPPSPILEDSGADTFEIHVGPPIVKLTLAELETNKLENSRQILRYWIAHDNANIARRQVGRIASTAPASWSTNALPVGESRQYVFGPNYATAEKELVPILTALAHNYRHNKCDAKLKSICELLRLLAPLLDEHGKELSGLASLANLEGGQRPPQDDELAKSTPY